MAVKSPSLTERIVPFLILASVLLAFGVGVLWQKVSILEGSDSKGTTTPTANTGTVANQQEVSVLDDLVGLATSLGVDKSKYEACVKDESVAQKVENQYQSGVTAGVRGTPGNFLINSKGEVWSVPGAVPFTNLKSIIEVALGNAPESSVTAVKMASADAAKVKRTMDGDHIKGNKNSQLYLVEYSDFQCPYCKSFYTSVEQALKEYDGKVALVYRHFPLDQIHPLARPAAVSSECVAKLEGEDAFWKFMDKVFAS